MPTEQQLTKLLHSITRCAGCGFVAEHWVRPLMALMEGEPTLHSCTCSRPNGAKAPGFSKRKLRRTGRGFADYASFKDTSGKEVVVRASSLATARRVWIFPEIWLTQEGPPASGAHLSEAQALKVIEALMRFVNGEG